LACPARFERATYALGDYKTPTSDYESGKRFPWLIF